MQPGLSVCGEVPGRHKKSSAAFGDVLCALDGSDGSREAMLQALALAAPATALRFVAVRGEPGLGRAGQAELDERRLRRTLGEAAARAGSHGVEASTTLLRGSPVSGMLLGEVERHDLLAIGCNGASRRGGILLGSSAARIARQAERPLLIARRSADGDEFPRSVLLASDGSPGSWAAARIAARLTQAGGCELRLAYAAREGDAERDRQVMKQAGMIERLTGSSPRLVAREGDPAQRIGEAARAAQSSLLVIGRGDSATAGLGRVAERLVHGAPCSVLAVPAGTRV